MEVFLGKIILIRKYLTSFSKKLLLKKAPRGSSPHCEEFNISGKHTPHQAHDIKTLLIQCWFSVKVEALLFQCCVPTWKFFCWSSLPWKCYYPMGKSGRWQTDDIFLIFLRKLDLTLHAKCLLWRQFVWSVKSYFQGKIRKIFENVCWNFYPACKVLEANAFISECSPFVMYPVT